jgi:cell division septal protein FtsQ
MDTKTKKRRVGAPQKRSAPKTVNPKTAGTGSAAARRTVTRRKKPAPEVVYIPPKPFNRNRLLLSLAITLAVVLALSFSISIFFSVEVVTVSGAEKYDAWTVKEASGIEYGDNLLSFGKAKAAGNIKLELPYVNTVRIGIKLPNTVNIEITEWDVLYSVRDAGNSWWLMNSEGTIIDNVDIATAGEYTKILGFAVADPMEGKPAKALETSSATDASGETLLSAVRASDQLNVALSIIGYLEDNGIIGEIASVDVSDIGDLELWYGQRFQVRLGEATDLNHKIKWLKAVVKGNDEKNTLKEYDSGILDISFTIKENQVIYDPFED